MDKKELKINLPVTIKVKPDKAPKLLRKKEQLDADEYLLYQKRKEEDAYLHKLVGKKHSYLIN